MSFRSPNPQKITPQDSPKFFDAFVKMSLSRIQLNLFYINIIPMKLYKDIMQYFNKELHVYGRKPSVILVPPLKIRLPKGLTIAIFGHPGGRRPMMSVFSHTISISYSETCTMRGTPVRTNLFTPGLILDK